MPPPPTTNHPYTRPHTLFSRSHTPTSIHISVAPAPPPPACVLMFIQPGLPRCESSFQCNLLYRYSFHIHTQSALELHCKLSGEEKKTKTFIQCNESSDTAKLLFSTKDRATAIKTHFFILFIFLLRLEERITKSIEMKCTFFFFK